MFNRHLPKLVYENLPWIYLAIATVLLVSVDTAWKWTAIAPLVLAAALTVGQRRKHRRRSPRARGPESGGRFRVRTS